MELADILALEGVQAPLRVTGKEALLRQLGELAASVHEVRVAVEAMGEVEAVVAAADEIDVVRQSHSGGTV